VNQGTLYVVATPIGNLQDLTLRALRVLQECDAVICEERRAGSTLLAHYHIEKPLYEWNEHSRAEDVRDFLVQLEHGTSFALISDHGTPLVQDPGHDLVKRAIESGVRVVPIPGASAILAALVASGIPARRFRFAGHLPSKNAERSRALEALIVRRETLIFVDAPYRLQAVLNSMLEAFGHERRAAVALDLTMPGERFERGTLAQLAKHFSEHPFKGEFVIIVQGSTKSESTR
jgi:16S rRNA (cytidine1402-2'-O)-methyltransferase